MKHWCTGCRSESGGPVELIHPASIAAGRCLTCRGLDVRQWYAEYVAERVARRLDGPAKRAKELRLRVYGGAGRPTASLTAAEARGRAVASC